MAKSNRFGKATVMTPDQLGQLWNEMNNPCRLVSQIAYFTAARIGEVLQLTAADLQGDTVIYRAVTTKTKKTRESQIPVQLAKLLSAASLPKQGYLFPGKGQTGHLTSRAVENSVKDAAALIGVDGVSTHSFRRSMATHLHLAGMPLRGIQRITGHATLAALEQYLDIERKEASLQHQAVLDKLFSN